jgi:hypothetical protein
MRTTHWTMLALAAAVCFTAWDMPPAESLRREMPAVRTQAAPVIDGKLDDAAWNNCPQMDFVYTIGTPGVPRQYTWGRLLYDNDRLYIAVKCQETEIELLKQTMTKRDSDVWNDDYIEVFIDTNLDRTNFYQIIVNPIATIYDQNSVDGNATWDGDIAVKTQVGADYWTVELSITFASLGIKPGTRDIGFNLDRYRVTRPSGGFQDTAWSPLRSWKSATPAAFGTLKGITVK